MDRKSLSEARVQLGGPVSTHEIAIGNLDQDFIFSVYNNLLFHTLALHYRTLTQLYNGDINDILKKYLKVPNEDFVFIMTTAEESSEVDKNAYGIITVIPNAWVAANKGEIIDIYPSLNIVDTNTQHAFDVVVSFLRKLKRLQDVVHNLSSENVSVRIFDAIFPQNVLQKLNPNWKDIPMYTEANNFTQFHITLFREAFQDLLNEANVDDGLAMLLY